MIPLSVPNLQGNEWNYIKDCLDTNWVSSVGSYVDRFEASMAAFTGSAFAISTVNGTAALHISLVLSGVKQGDLVIVPNITFIASVNSIKYAGAEPILMDVEEGNWQMDLTLLEMFLNTETKQQAGLCIHTKTGKIVRAVMPVHVLGNMCDMHRLMKLADMHGLVVVEDATEALGSTFSGKHAGTFGRFGCFSYNGNKIITTGGGGMIVTNDPGLAKRAKHITTQAKSDPFEYLHDEVGYNYRLVNILAAMGLAQMELLPGFLERKKEIARMYHENLASLPGFQFNTVEKNVKPNLWLYTVRCTKQKELIPHLLKNNIQVRPFWVPMNQLIMFKDSIYFNRKNISGAVYANSLSLPCSTGIKNEEIWTVIEKIREICS
jgi:perosamine synthetase